ncbi:MAG TPA: GDP-mannose 4,6-dehydratase [bacterium]|nr:GDP-mannose 4,6-dehydratase [bacterium]
MSEQRQKTVLITGGSGFAGRHLIAALTETGAEVHVLDRTRIAARGEAWLSTGIQTHLTDLTHPDGLRELIGRIRPDDIYHLAGRANVKHSWHGETETYTVNVIGAVNLLCAVRDTGLGSRILIVSSGEVYGNVPESEQPITETTQPRPRSPYAASKYCQEIAALQLAQTMKGKVVIARPFNHIGPGQRLGFVTADFAYQVARIEQGLQEPVIQVGNLDARRDFTDVRDTVSGYIHALEHGTPGDVINVCSSRTCRIRDFLDFFMGRSTAEISVKIDPDRFRPADVPILQGSHRYLTEISGWAPQRTIEDTLDEILQYWRSQTADGLASDS